MIATIPENSGKVIHPKLVQKKNEGGCFCRLCFTHCDEYGQRLSQRQLTLISNKTPFKSYFFSLSSPARNKIVKKSTLFWKLTTDILKPTCKKIGK